MADDNDTTDADLVEDEAAEDEITEAVITTALWDYTKPDGTRAIAYHGQTVAISADEYDRGDRSGVFSQPQVSPGSTVELPRPALSENFADVYDTLAAGLPQPGPIVGDDTVALLHHDLQQPVIPADADAVELAVTENPVIEPVATSEAPPAVTAPTVPVKPAHTALKPLWVEYAVAKTAGTEHAISYEEADAFNKAELIAEFGGE